MIRVIKPGLQTTVQDSGRIGFYNIGMPPSGAMDIYSFKIANMLVENDLNAAVLEITYMGPELQFEQDTTIAITGGQIPPKVNGNDVPMWTSINIKDGDVLSFDFVRGGARAYMSVSGGIEVPEILGSKSTYTLCGIGGYKGRQLSKDDELGIGGVSSTPKEGVSIASDLIPRYEKNHEIRVVLGLCSYRLTEESKDRFFSTDWTVTPEANRVGYRFKGERLDFVPRDQPFGAGSNPSNVVDLGYPIGSIQVPDGVEPIALLNDAVTGGGYATIATIISSDLSKMAQVKTNENVRFVAVNIEDALTARQELQQRLERARIGISESN